MGNWYDGNRNKQIQMKLKQQPKLIYYSLTHEFQVEKEDGTILEVRKYEDTNGGGMLIYNQETKDWEEVYDRDTMLEIEEAVEDFNFFSL